jgi:hypothetical protein
MVATRLAQLSATDRDLTDARASVFIEQVLLHELGPEFLRSPTFKPTARRIQSTMNSDPALKAELDVLLAAMVDAPDP